MQYDIKSLIRALPARITERDQSSGFLQKFDAVSQPKWITFSVPTLDLPCVELTQHLPPWVAIH